MEIDGQNIHQYSIKYTYRFGSPARFGSVEAPAMMRQPTGVSPSTPESRRGFSRS